MVNDSLTRIQEIEFVSAIGEVDVVVDIGCRHTTIGHTIAIACEDDMVIGVEYEVGFDNM